MNDVKDFQTVRIMFAKEGPARYISHLDLNRTMIRALRRAQLPIWYTEGFNKHPYVTFAAPLSLGYEGERETMDVRLNEVLPMQEVVDRLNAVMPTGLRILKADTAVRKAGDVDRAVYRITVQCPLEQVETYLAQPTIAVQKRTKKKTWKELDLRPVLDRAESTLSVQGNTTVWQLTLPCNSNESINPSLVMEGFKQFSNEVEALFFVRRLCVLDKDGKEFA